MPSETSARGQAGVLVDALALVLSSLFITAINICVSGQLLGYLFSLGQDGDEHMTIVLPVVFKFSARGSRLLAGFCSFIVWLLLVAVFFRAWSKQVFIDDLQATASPWTAAEILATLFSVTAAVILVAVKAAIVKWTAGRKLIDSIPGKGLDREQADRIARRD